MADQKLEGEVVIPDKDTLLGNNAEGTSEPQTEEPTYTEVEKAAMAQGWKPKDQWTGNPDDHRSAREYLDRGELLGKIKSQSQQLTEIRNALIGMSEHNKQVYKAGYEKALVDLKAQKLAALREGDAEAVLAIDDKIDATKEAIQQIKQTPPPVAEQPRQASEVTANWLAKNDWYSKESAMKHAANGYAIDLAKTNPHITETEIYEFIDRKIREDFPHKFNRQNASAPSPDGEGRRSAGGAGGGKGGAISFEKILASMNETQASIARSLVKTGGLTKEKYVEDWVKINGGQ